MKIEVGKYYKTRDGRRVRIYAVDASGRWPVHGASLWDNTIWRCEEWTAEGLHGDDINGLDIVSEWEEPMHQVDSLENKIKRLEEIVLFLSQQALTVRWSPRQDAVDEFKALVKELEEE